MDVQTGISQDIQQALSLSRQAIQSIEILEFSQDDLDGFVQEHIERNPLLRLSDRDTHPASYYALETKGVPSAQMFGDSQSRGTGVDVPSLEETISAERTLHDHLLEQTAFLRISSEQRGYVEFLINSLEPDGYLRSRLEDLADLLNVSADTLEDALKVVQGLDPAGIGARNLKECLVLQLHEKSPLNVTQSALLDHLELVRTGDFKRLARVCGVTLNQLSCLLDSLRRLNPKPGYNFGNDKPLPVLPDVLATIGNGGRIRVEINPELLPRALLDREYYTELSTQLHRHEDKAFLQNCLFEANMLIRMLHQRTQTILKVATEIARNQISFFVHGTRELRPLLQKDIARTLGIHESTVSRAVANKHMLCSQGQVPLKYFFSDAVSQDASGQGVAAAAVQHKIETLVAQESHESVLSDEAIVDALQKEGIQIARRTVAKYRKQLGIPSSAQRRREVTWKSLTAH